LVLLRSVFNHTVTRKLSVIRTFFVRWIASMGALVCETMRRLDKDSSGLILLTVPSCASADVPEAQGG
jgi:23S rRNA-/tRNA-specific pseudouridylate synthase